MQARDARLQQLELRRRAGKRRARLEAAHDRQRIAPAIGLRVSGKGVKTSMCAPGANTDPKSNDAGSTPTTSVGAPSMMIGLPTIAGFDAKRRSHSAWLISTAFGPFHALSSGVKLRPIIGRTPSSGKKFCDTAPR